PGLQAGPGNGAGLIAVAARRPPAAKRPDEVSPEEAQPVCGEGEVADGPPELSYKTPNGSAPSKDLFLGSSRQGCGSGGVQVPTPSVARFGRLAGLDPEPATAPECAPTSKPWPPGWPGTAPAVGATGRASQHGGLKRK